MIMCSDGIQARQLGGYAARCMCDRDVGEPDMYNFFFEMFAHVTQFLGYKVSTYFCCTIFVWVLNRQLLVSIQVIFLGRFNGQGLPIELINTMNEYLKSSQPSIISASGNDYIFIKSK